MSTNGLGLISRCSFFHLLFQLVEENAAKAGSEAAPSQDVQQELSRAQEELSKLKEELSKLKEEGQKKQNEVGEDPRRSVVTGTDGRLHVFLN